MRRGSERVELGEYEQASFGGPGSRLVKRAVVAPPILLTPTNMAPVVIRETETAEVEFTWSAVATADSYRLKVSSSPIFATLAHDRRIRSTSVRLPSLREGDYYWTVTSVDSSRQESQESEPNHSLEPEQAATRMGATSPTIARIRRRGCRVIHVRG